MSMPVTVSFEAESTTQVIELIREYLRQAVVPTAAGDAAPRFRSLDELMAKMRLPQRKPLWDELLDAFLTGNGRIQMTALERSLGKRGPDGRQDIGRTLGSMTKTAQRLFKEPLYSASGWGTEWDGHRQQRDRTYTINARLWRSDAKS